MPSIWRKLIKYVVCARTKPRKRLPLQYNRPPIEWPNPVLVDEEDHPAASPNYFEKFGTEYPKVSTRVVSPCRKITNSVAFVKESEDPRRDFRRSMLQMIFDREIRSREDMQELLNCFLQLNSHSHHDAIIQAFSEIWNAVFSDKNGPAAFM